MVVEPVTTRRQRKQFFELPWRLYKGNPNWIPPLRTNQKELLGFKKHPFYIRNKIQTFLATRDGVPCGRIAAIVNFDHTDRYRDNLGFFGFYESEDDPAIAAPLFDAARQWLSAQGLPTMRGPNNPSLNYEAGLLIDGFDTPPSFMMTYGQTYYQRLFEDYGFRKAQDLYAYWGHSDMLATLDKKLEFVSGEAKSRFGISVRSMDKKRFDQEVKMYLELYNRALVATWGFVPMSDEEIRHMAKGLKSLIEPELTCVAEVDGKVVGGVFCLLDYNSRIKEIDGRLFPFGFLKLITKRRQIKRIRAIATTVVPEYQKWGVGLVVLSGLLPKAMAWGVEEAEFSWVLESNDLSRRSLEKGGAKRIKTFRLYDIGDPLPER
ncbi:MAG: N-acetyltransferase [Planctomycetia bacterium]|nr:N-acetyltransferase [Planctomycetia bacterium]